MTTTELETKETKQSIYVLLLNVFACLNVLNVMYFFHRIVGFKKSAAVLSELFWCANDALELYNGQHYDLLVGNEGDQKELIQEELIIIASLEETNSKPILVEEVKYEDKYLKEIKNCSLYSSDFIRERDAKMADILAVIQIKDSNEMKILKQRILKLNDSLDYLDSLKTKEREELILKIQEIEYNLENPNMLKIEEEALLYVKNTYLDGLLNNFVMEKTPLGNVIMYYNNKRGSFEYYSDNTIPYRYLETTSRKYVKTFNCVYLYVDMLQELNEIKKKVEKEDKEKEDKEKEEKEEKEQLILLGLEKPNDNIKKNVFAKFKNYNKESGTGRVNTGVAPKNSVPNNNNLKIKEEKVQLKQNANRFTSQGKISNFHFLKVPERKVTNKKLATSFSDFKKMNLIK